MALSLPPSKALHVRISGMVQGVGFRWWTARLAEELALAGWVRNEPDGGVSIFVHGAQTAVSEFVSRLSLGPAGARVDEVITSDAAPDSRETFEILR